jgi:hypothetical protein
MENPRHSTDNLRVTYWLKVFMTIFLIVPIVLTGITQSIGLGNLLPNWLLYLCQSIGFLCWGIASLIVVSVEHCRQPYASFYVQSRLWFGLTGIALFSNLIILTLETSHMLSDSALLNTMINVSVTAALICAVLGVFFWLRKRRIMARGL